MDINLIILIISGAVCLVGGISLTYNLYKMTIIDARARGLKHPKLIGFFSAYGNNGNGILLLYLIMRNKYPLKDLSESDKKELKLYKKKSMLALSFHLIATVIFLVIFVFKFF